MMGRPPCCDKLNVKRGLWTPEEDAKMLAYVSTHGIGNWTNVPKRAGLNRCGKSCRLRWTNYLRPDLKHDNFTPHEEQLIISLHQAVGSRWSLIAQWLPGRTDNDVKNYWNTKLKKKLQKMGIDPVTHKPFSQIFSDYGNISTTTTTNTAISSAFNPILIPKPEPMQSSVLTGPPSNFILRPNNNIGQIQDISWQFEFTQPHLFTETISSASSSSSSTSFTRLNSPKSYPPQQSQSTTPIAAPASNSSSSPPCLWNEFLLGEPADFKQQQEQDMMSQIGPYECAAEGRMNQTTNNFTDQTSSSSTTSFVDDILVKDNEMRSQFPQLLDPSFDY